ncbi:MAG TPA: SUMF1/EgtB/PvdO family nonheme iron enzyme, partial [Alphaproteobacteria bacterium]|nr:SUMF1/EgtB/PvdO family nonheme iron enzyme [Alphaproteobacteria bacterium]
MRAWIGATFCGLLALLATATAGADVQSSHYPGLGPNCAILYDEYLRKSGPAWSAKAFSVAAHRPTSSLVCAYGRQAGDAIKGCQATRATPQSSSLPYGSAAKGQARKSYDGGRRARNAANCTVYARGSRRIVAQAPKQAPPRKVVKPVVTSKPKSKPAPRKQAPQAKPAAKKTTSPTAPTVVTKPPTRSVNRHAVAVIIGNKTYSGGTPPVDFAHNDAAAMKRFVIEILGYRPGNVIDMRNATGTQIEAVFGNHRTHQGKLFDWLRPGQSDVLVFYSGHGVPGLRDRRAYLLPVDGDPNRAEITGYPLDVLYANLAKLPARSLTVYLDACFSGQSPKGMIVRAASGISVTAKAPRRAGGMTILTAAQGDQLASWDEDARHGLFTRYLIEALRGAADQPNFGNRDGHVTLAEVAAYLNDEMSYQARRKWGRRQTASVQGNRQAVLAPNATPQGTGSARTTAPPRPVPTSKWSNPDAAGSSSASPGSAAKDCEVCPEMVTVPPGRFLMGSNSGDSVEKPVHQVSVRAFAVGKYEVTFAEWDACVSGGGCNGYFPPDEGWGRGRRPVINVSWYDAQAYIDWLSRRSGQRYRLLSEAEWEYATRAGTTSRYWLGNRIDHRQANFGGRLKSTAAAGSFGANPFGLFDVHGNLWEWVEDCAN